MRRIHSRRTSRSAFTLIELLVVIAIIAILVSLTAAGVMRTLLVIPQVQTRTDIGQFDTALAAFMSDYNLSVPPPSVLVLHEDMNYNMANPLEARSRAFLIQAFGKNLGSSGTIDWNGDGVADGPWTLTGEQCLVFYTGGIPSVATGQCTGFSTNNINPAQATPTRRGPYMNFNNSRLVAAGGFFIYLDAWKTKTGPTYAALGGSPYAYFSSFGINNGYSADSSYGASPYATGVGQYTYPNTYQIISAGQDGTFGGGLWSPSSAHPGAGRDDQANFSSKILGAGQQ